MQYLGIIKSLGTDKEGEERKISCRQYLERVNRIALEKNALIQHGISKTKKGDSMIKSKIFKNSK